MRPEYIIIFLFGAVFGFLTHMIVFKEVIRIFMNQSKEMIRLFRILEIAQKRYMRSKKTTNN